MNRRGFIGALIAGLTLDPERALWIPGKKLISIPATSIRIAPSDQWLALESLTILRDSIEINRHWYYLHRDTIDGMPLRVGDKFQVRMPHRLVSL